MSKVLKMMDIFMDGGPNNIFHRVTIISIDGDGLKGGVISPIISVSLLCHLNVVGELLSPFPHICFAPSNCFAHHPSNVGGCHVRGIGLKVCHIHKGTTII